MSRKFLYQQGKIAQKALKTAFEKPEKDNEVLYHLPVTQKWLFQLILGLILIFHSSYRGVVELLRDLFDYPISVGTLKNRVTEAVEKARTLNQAQDLSAVKVGLLFGDLSGKSTGVDWSGCRVDLLFLVGRSRPARRRYVGLLSTRNG